MEFESCVEFDNCNKIEFVKEVAKKVEGSSKKLAGEFVNAVFEVIQEQLLDCRGVNINGVGKFKPFIKEGATYIDLSKKDNNGKLLRDKNGKPFTKTIPDRYSIKFTFIPSFSQKIKQVTID